MARGKHPIGYWNKERCAKAALKFHTKTQFAKGENGAYTFALKNGFLDEICAHMETRWVKKWASKEACHREALKFNSRSAFAKGCDGAYTYAMRHGFLDEICSHMTPLWEKKWNSKAKCQSEALKYKRRIDFQRGCDGAYTYAMRHGFLDEICQHMETYFDVDSAEKDKKRAAFVKNKLQISNEEWNKIEYLLCNPEGYAIQSSRARNKRLIYACEFEDHHVYVGLARNLKSRIAQHLGSSKEKSAIYLHMQKNPYLLPNFKVVRPFEDEEVAKIDEGLVEKEYETNGWIILNRAKTGSLGGYPSYWNHDRCVAVASQCVTRKEFCKKCSGAYASCARNGWLQEIYTIIDTNFMNKWSNVKIKEAAENYSTKGEFRKGDPEAHYAAIRFNLIDSLFPEKKEERKPSIKSQICFDFNYCVDIAKTCCTRREFNASHRNLLVLCKKNNWLDRIYSIIDKSLVEQWPEESIRKEAQKYSSLRAFKKGSFEAYLAAEYLKITDSLFLNKVNNNMLIVEDYDYCMSVAEKYKSYVKFRTNRAHVYKICKDNGWVIDAKRIIDQSFLADWPEESVRKEALHFDCLKSFRYNSRNAYKASVLLGIKDSLFPKKVLKKAPKKQTPYKKEKVSRIKWTRETLKREALKYNTRMEFKAKSGGAYTTAGIMGIRDEICAHMYHPTTPQKYTDEDIYNEAQKYSSVKEFKKGAPSMLTIAQSRGILHDVCKHFKPLRKPFNETVEDLKKIASTCHSRMEFRTKHPHEYYSAKKSGVFEDVCSVILSE